MNPCFFCGSHQTEEVLRVTDADLLQEFRIAVGIPPDAHVVWPVCAECIRLDKQTITNHIHEHMVTRAISRYHRGLPTVIEDDEMLMSFLVRAIELLRKNDRPAEEVELYVELERVTAHALKHQTRRLPVRDGQLRTSIGNADKRIGRLPVMTSDKSCPRCGGPILKGDGIMVSRVDNRTDICLHCYDQEAWTWPTDPWHQETWAKEQRAQWKHP